MPQVSAPAKRVAVTIGLALLMIPIGGLLFMFSGNAVFHRWLEITGTMSYGEACGAMTLLWMIRFFMYR